MVTYFNRKDLVSFGTYLLSETRKARFEQMSKEMEGQGIKNFPSAEERMKDVNHADIENWLEDQKQKRQE